MGALIYFQRPSVQKKRQCTVAEHIAGDCVYITNTVFDIPSVLNCTIENNQAPSFPPGVHNRFTALIAIIFPLNDDFASENNRRKREMHFAIAPENATIRYLKWLD